MAVLLPVLLTACGGADETAAPEGAEGASDADGVSDEVAEGDEETYTITLASPLGEAGLMTSTDWWAEEVEARTNRRVEVDIFYAGSLVGPLELLPAIRDGRVTGGWMSDPYWPTEFPLWQVVGIPFETTDAAALNRTWHELYEGHEPFRREFDEAGVHILFFQPYSETVLGTTQAVEEPDDLAGLRIRSVGYISNALQALDAEPAAVDATGVYEALQRGVIDGHATPFDAATQLGLHEVAPMTVDSGMGHYASSAIGIDLDFWNDLPEDLQEILTEVSTELVDGLAIEHLIGLEDDACELYLNEDGVELGVWEDSALSEVRDRLGDDIRDEWRNEAIERGVDEADVDAFYETFHETYRGHKDASSYMSPVARCLDL